MSKLIGLILCAVVLLPGCGTLGGAVSGAGDDLQRAGEWIRSK